MALLNKRWTGSSFKTGATFRRWTGSAWKTGATTRIWTGADWIPSLRLEITGGTKYVHGLYTYHMFTKVGKTDITVKGKGEIEWLLAGGGGGGGVSNGYSVTRSWEICGGGGGTLNVLTGSSYTLTPGTYSVYVGAGGAGGGSTGNPSYISDIPTAYARGGGSGQSGQITGTDIPAKAGGSGGGAGAGLPSGAPNKNPKHPNAQTFANYGGYESRIGNYTYSGNGGGAGGAGTNASQGSVNGLIPPGSWYKPGNQPMAALCAGGRGGSEYSGDGPSGGASPMGAHGPVNSGNGGGGGYTGGSGVVYIRYLTPK